MDLQVAGLGDLEARVETALSRIIELQKGTRIRSDAFFSEAFMTEHTSFESFEAFCSASPFSLDDRREILTVERERLDDFVADTTDFESWEGMKTRAAEERIIDQIQS